MPLAFIMAPRSSLVGGKFVDENECILIVRNVLLVHFFFLAGLYELTFFGLSYFFHTGQKG